MTCLCPTCGGPLAEKPKPLVDLSSNTILAKGQAVKVQGKAAELMEVLAKRFPAVVSHDAIGLALYGADGGSENSIKTTVCKLRKDLSKVGFGIENISGRGYRLVETTGACDEKHPRNNP